ncbi:RND transporter [Novosphingobium sp. Leaf2]|nr:RND transporter [Novosphingobium sp. Leaf2]
MPDTDAHSPVDTLLGAAPQRIMRHWLSLLILALAGLGAAAFFVRFVNGEDTPYYSATIEQGDLVPLVSERGELHGNGEITLYAPADGRITWASDKSTGPVARGEVLARLDDPEKRSSVAVERARAAAAQAALDAAQVAAQDAAARLSRFETVWRRSGGRAPSLNEMERARAEAARTALVVASARAEVQAASLALKQDLAQMAGFAVKAPFAGLVVERRVQAGQQVSAHDPLFILAASIAPMSVEIPLGALPTGPIKAGTLAQVRPDSSPDTPQAATMTLLRLSPSPQEIPPRAVFTIANPGPHMRPGMAATVDIELPRRHNVLLVPDAALKFDPAGQTGRQRARIYILDGGEPRRVYVQVGGSDGKRTEVFAPGLKPGDQVITGWRDAMSGPARSGQ